jgi:hypothetical protein
MFDMHKLNDKGFSEMAAFKNHMAIAVDVALKQMPESREKSLFVTKLEEAVFFGAKAIASKDGNFDYIDCYPKVGKTS